MLGYASLDWSRDGSSGCAGQSREASDTAQLPTVDASGCNPAARNDPSREFLKWDRVEHWPPEGKSRLAIPAPFVWRHLTSPTMPDLQPPLIELDAQFSRIRDRGRWDMLVDQKWIAQATMVIETRSFRMRLDPDHGKLTEDEHSPSELATPVTPISGSGE